MRRLLLPAAALACALSLSIPALASAEIVEMGTLDPNQPSQCPTSDTKTGVICYALTASTAYQAKNGATKDPMVAAKDGKVVAVTLQLAAPTASQIKFFTTGDKAGNGKFGEASVRVSILDPRKGKSKKFQARVVAQSEDIKVADYFGSTSQFALKTSLPVKKGQIVAITTTTWVPILATSAPPPTLNVPSVPLQSGTTLGNDFSWRVSRPRGTCSDVPQRTAQIKVGALTQYGCLYLRGKLNYAATLIADPPVTTKTKTPADATPKSN